MKLKDNIKNNYTKYIIGTFIIISVLLIAYILFKYPQVGVADQGDFDRVMGLSGLSLLDSDKMNPDFKRFYDYIVTDYKINTNMFTLLITLFGSSMGYLITFISYICKVLGQEVFKTQYLAIAYAIIYISSIAIILKNLNIKSKLKLTIISYICKVLGQEVFKTQYLAIAYAIIYISSIAIILKNLNIKSKLKLTIVALVSIFVFMDGNYILWFNSLYGEPMMLCTLLLFIGTFLYYINCKYVRYDESNIASKISLVYIGAFMFLGSKMQVFTTLPFVVILLCKILWDNRNILTRKNLILLSVFLAVVVIYPVQINMVNKNISKDTQYNSVFYGVLNGSETPEQDLIDLGLNPDMAGEAGKHSYLDASEYVKYIPRTPITEEEFYSKISNGKLAKFYLTHPKRLIEGMQYTAGKAFITSTSLGKCYRADSEEPVREFNRFTTWSNFRETESVIELTVKNQ